MFFGLNEEQELSQWLFEKTFGLKFNEDFKNDKNLSQRKIVVSEKYVEDLGIYDIYKYRKNVVKRYTGKRVDRNKKHEDVVYITPQNISRIKQLNKQDIEFYNYARRLFFERVRYFT